MFLIDNSSPLSAQRTSIEYITWLDHAPSPFIFWKGLILLDNPYGAYIILFLNPLILEMSGFGS